MGHIQGTGHNEHQVHKDLDHRRAAGKPLIESAEIEKIADVVFNAPFAILSHNRFAPNVSDEEAVYTYANQARSCRLHDCQISLSNAGTRYTFHYRWCEGLIKARGRP